MSDVSRIRVSDAERNGVVARLQEAAVEGRLSLDELEARVIAAVDARTWADLSALVDDLPEPSQDPPATAAPEAEPSPVREALERAGATAVLGLGALSLLVGVLIGFGWLLGIVAALAGVAVLLMPGELSVVHRLAVVGGTACGLAAVLVSVLSLLS